MLSIYYIATGVFPDYELSLHVAMLIWSLPFQNNFLEKNGCVFISDYSFYDSGENRPVAVIHLNHSLLIQSRDRAWFNVGILFSIEHDNPASLPAIRPTSGVRIRPVFSHNTEYWYTNTDLLFRLRFIHCAMVNPFILYCFSFSLTDKQKGGKLQKRCVFYCIIH